MRETLFNWLMLWVPGKRCLDLYAGTGALGFEALSRDAASCIFVERDRRAAETLRSNARTLDASTASVREGDARAILKQIEPGSVDLVFLDPPFAAGGMAELCSLVAESGILARGARVYLEEPRDAPETRLPEDWQLEKTATAGNVRYSLASTGSQ